MSSDHKTGLQLRSLIKKSGELEISLVSVPTPEPSADEVVVRVEASPINPSDLGLLIGAADMATAKATGSKDAPAITAHVPEAAMKGMAGRLDESMPVGNEGAGVVVGTGSSDAAKALMGKTVAMIGGAMYAQYRTIRARDCLVLPAGTTPAEGASCFVNPLTALGMVETMRREGHKALVHTAAASNLGQMLNRICLKDGISLVNIVRSPQQAEILRKIGAKHIVRFHHAHLHGRSDQCAGGNRRDAGVRRYRRRQARWPNSHLHGDISQQDRQGLQPLWLERAQAGLYLRRSRSSARSS